MVNAKPTAVTEMPPVRPLSYADRRVAEVTLGTAFFDDPVWLWLLGGRMSPRRAGMVLASLCMAHVEDGVSTITKGGHAVAAWAPPKRFRVDPLAMLPEARRVLNGLGPAGLMRLNWLAPLERIHPSEPHYYLAVLGTLPSRQGEGLGTAVMAPTLEQADHEGVGCYLESSKEANVPFYRRLGFEVTGTHEAGHGCPRMWLMWRDPVPPDDR